MVNPVSQGVRRKRGAKTDWRFYVMLLFPAAFLLMFSYVPLYGLVMAFQDYNPALGVLNSPFVGFEQFRTFFQMPDSWKIIRNTVCIALGKIFLGQLTSILFALLLNEVHNKIYKKAVQTVTYFPHFLSWVIIGTVFIDMLSTKGIINQGISALGGKPVFFLGSTGYFQPTVIFLETWKEFGWGAIIYLAAISSISPELYEAATIDGAGRLKQALYITLPGIKGTILMLVVLAMGNVLNAGFEQILVLYNPAVYETADILDTFIYRQGLLDAQFSLSTAIGLLKSVIGMALVIGANFLATKFSEYRIF